MCILCNSHPAASPGASGRRMVYPVMVYRLLPPPLDQFLALCANDARGRRSLCAIGSQAVPPVSTERLQTRRVLAHGRARSANRKSRLIVDQAAFHLVPRRGLEPPRSYPLVPETSASTNSATWAGTQTASRPAQSVF